MLHGCVRPLRLLASNGKSSIRLKSKQRLFRKSAAIGGSTCVCGHPAANCSKSIRRSTPCGSTGKNFGVIGLGPLSKKTQEPPNMKTRNQRNMNHATASAGTDALAPPNSPVGQVKNKLTGLLPRKTPLYLGFWNVRTLKSIETQTLTMRTLNQYKIDVACLSEVRLPNTGHQTIKIPNHSNSYHLYHSGVSDNSGLHGVAFALTSKANAALLEWDPISPRIARIRLKGAIFNITIFSVYAPTLDSEERIKDEFYASLQHAVSNVPSGDLLLIAGDWNARPGTNDAVTRPILGKHSIGNRCLNGERMINFAMLNRCVIASSRFRHPDNHLITWYSNDGFTKAQIDHLLVRSRWASCIQDCRAYRGAETGQQSGSDHTLVRAKVKLHLKVIPKKQSHPKFDVNKLQCEATRHEFQLDLHNRFNGLVPLNDANTSVDEIWKSLKSNVQASADHHLGKQPRVSKDWISQETINLADRAKQAKAHNHHTFPDLRRATSRSAKKDRNIYWSSIASYMEQAAAVGDNRKLYQLLKTSSKGTSSLSDSIEDENGDVITNLDKRCERWKRHFESLLKHDPPSNPPIALPHRQQYDCIDTPPTEAEIFDAIKTLRNNKAPGEDGICAEIYKSSPCVMSTWLHKVISVIWETEQVPQDWSDAIIVPFHKKGNKRQCANYRGISLIDIAAKIFATILLKRFVTQRDARTRPQQAGFRPNRGCIDQIFSLRRILEHRWCYQQSTVICFIDFTAAFDSLDRLALWQIMEADGIPPKLLNLIRAYYASTRSRVRCYNTMTDVFAVESGVRQGCPLSPTLFNYAVDYVLNNAVEGFAGVELCPSLELTDLDYADDIAIIANTHQEMQDVLGRINQFSSSIGLKINNAKTKVMSSVPVNERTPIIVDSTALEEVPSFTYLGSTLLPNGQSKDEISKRIDKARSAFGRLQRCLWSRSEIRRSTKMRIYQALIRSILLYGCETWAVRSSDVLAVDVFDRNCLRRILGIKPLDLVNNVLLYRRSNLQPITQDVTVRRLRWLGHALRRNPGDLIHDVVNLEPLPQWRRRRGGQLTTWLSTVQHDMEKMSGPRVYGLRRWKREWLTITHSLANDRQAWSAYIRDFVQSTDGAGSTHLG